MTDAPRGPDGVTQDGTLTAESLDAWHTVQRSWTGLVIVYVTVGGVFALGCVPAVQDLLGNTTLEMGLACGAVAFIATLGVAMYYALGVRSPIYQRYDVVETIAVQLVLNALVFTSSQRISPMWAVWMLHTCLSGSSNISARLAWGIAPVHLGLPLLIGAVRLHEGDVPGAALTVVMSLAGMMGYTYGRSFVNRLRELAADRLRLMSDLNQLRLAEDRRRIARDLHDGLGAELAAIAWRSAALAHKAGTAPLGDELRALTARASSGIDEIRSVVWAADASERPWSEVVAYVRGRARELAPEGRIEISDSGDEVVLPGTFTAHYLRFVLEALRNAVTHGGDGVVRVRLAAGDAIEATVDNAAPTLPVGKAVGSGLANLQKRAALLGGTASLGVEGDRFVARLTAPRPALAAAATAAH